MKVEKTFDKSFCSNCDEYCDELYEVCDDYGNIIIKLCKQCLLNLLKAIIER